MTQPTEQELDAQWRAERAAYLAQQPWWEAWLAYSHTSGFHPMMRAFEAGWHAGRGVAMNLAETTTVRRLVLTDAAQVLENHLPRQAWYLRPGIRWSINVLRLAAEKAR